MANNEYDAAMSFDEIAGRLGISKAMAFVHYSRGMAKLRRGNRRVLLCGLQTLVAELRQETESRML